MKCLEKKEIREKQKVVSTDKSIRRDVVNNNRETIVKRRRSLPYDVRIVVSHFHTIFHSIYDTIFDSWIIFIGMPHTSPMKRANIATAVKKVNGFGECCSAVVACNGFMIVVSGI